MFCSKQQNKSSIIRDLLKWNFIQYIGYLMAEWNLIILVKKADIKRIV